MTLKDRHTVLGFMMLFLATFVPVSVLGEPISGTVKVKGLRSLENIVIYVTSIPDKTTETIKGNIVMNQQSLTFLPHVLPIPLGATVVFPNNDQVDHNVFSLSKPKNFNLGTYGPGGAKSVVFNKPGLVQLRCDMHAEMSAYILVMKNGYFGLTDRKGRFTIPDNNYRKKLGLNPLKELPPGSYKVRTWHEKLRNSKKSFVVKNSESLMLNLKLKRGAPGVLYKK